MLLQRAKTMMQRNHGGRREILQPHITWGGDCQLVNGTYYDVFGEHLSYSHYKEVRLGLHLIFITDPIRGVV